MSSEPPGWRRFFPRAARLLGRRAELARLVARAGGRLAQRGGTSAALAQVRDELRTLLELLDAWRTGEYRGVERSSLIMITAALLYFLAPFDVIPDVVLGAGFVDDATVIALVYSRLRGEIEAFRAWRERPNGPEPLPPPGPP